MGDTKTAPKRWCLSEHETLNSFEVWRQHQIWCLSQEKTFAPFLTDGITWSKKSTTNPTRGFTNDGGDNGVTAAQKVLHLESLLQQICNFCPIVSRSTQCISTIIHMCSKSFASFPHILRLLIKRFDNNLKKVNTPINIPTSIRVSSQQYKLVGIIHHINGNTDVLHAGHYTATINYKGFQYADDLTVKT